MNWIPTWISVEDDMPNENEQIVVATDVGVYIAKYVKNDGFKNYDFYDIHEVTHWMALSPVPSI